MVIYDLPAVVPRTGWGLLLWLPQQHADGRYTLSPSWWLPPGATLFGW